MARVFANMTATAIVPFFLMSASMTAWIGDPLYNVRTWIGGSKEEELSRLKSFVLLRRWFPLEEFPNNTETNGFSTNSK